MSKVRNLSNKDIVEAIEKSDKFEEEQENIRKNNVELMCTLEDISKKLSTLLVYFAIITGQDLDKDETE